MDDDTTICDLCHDNPATDIRNGHRLCPECRDHEDEWESLTPAEKFAEEEAMARYATESALERY